MFIYGFECDIVYMLCFFNRLVGSFVSLHICVFHRLYAKDGNTHHDSSRFFLETSVLTFCSVPEELEVIIFKTVKC